MSLEFQEYYMDIFNYFNANIHITIALGGVLLLLLLKKPKLFFTITFIVAVNVSVLYIISYTAAVSDMQKEKLISKTTEQIRAF